MAHEFSYILRLNVGSDPIIVGNKTGVKYRVTAGATKHSIVSSFEYCHHQSSSASSFAMQNNIEVSGLIKAFNVGASHAHQYAKSSSAAIQKGSGISKFLDESSFTFTDVEHTVEDGQFLVQYCEVKCLCWKLKGGTRQLLHVPTSPPVVECIDLEGLKALSTAYAGRLDSNSWRIVAGRLNVEMRDLAKDASELVPLEIEAPKQAPKQAPKKPMSMDGKVFKMINRWSGENKWISFTSGKKELRAIYNENDAMPVKMFATGAPNTYIMKNMWSGENKWVSFTDDGKWLKAAYEKQSDAMPVELHPADRPNTYYLKNVWAGYNPQSKWISFTWDGRWLRAVYDDKEKDAMPVEFVPHNL